MNIRNYHKYFKDYTVKTSTNITDDFGGITVGFTIKKIRGYFSKSMSSSGGDYINPRTISTGILFTDPTTLLNTGDILDGRYQIIDYDKHASHNEYKLEFKDTFGNNAGEGKGA